MRKALIAGCAVLGIGATATLAAWSDDTWVSGLFNTNGGSGGRGILKIQTALAPDAFDDQAEQTEQTTQSGQDGTAAHLLQRSTETETETELDSTSFTAPVTLAPGQTTYLPVYLRTSPDTESDAIVSVSQAHDGGADHSEAHTPPAIWGSPDTPGLATYGARIQQLDDPANPPACEATFFDQHSPDATDLVDGLVPMAAAAPTTQFALAGEAGNTYMVCFRFHLDPRVVTESPEANGAPFQPSWTFTGEAMDQ